MFTRRRIAAVLFDRDGALVKDVPHNTDPRRVEPRPGAREALQRLRAADVPVGVVTNQAGVAQGLITPDELHQVNARVEELLGPFDAWAICVHGEREGCACRKPAPGLVLRAAAAMGVRPTQCALVGDIGRDMLAALTAGARGILVPTRRTSAREVAAAAEVVRDLPAAVAAILPDTSIEQEWAGLGDLAAGVAAWSRW